MQQRLIQGIDKLDKVQELLGDKFGFPKLRFYTDETQFLTTRQIEGLQTLGFEPNGSNCWEYRETNTTA